MIRSRGFVLLAVCMLVFALGASAFADHPQRVELTLMAHMGAGAAPGDTVLKYIDEYQRLHPNVTIHYLHTSAGTFNDRLFALTAGGTAPDIIHMRNGDFPTYVEANLIAPVPTHVDALVRSRYLPGAVGIAEYEGRLYGYPSQNMPLGLVYNTRIFAEAGLGDDAPRTWDEMRDYARKTSFHNPDGSIRSLGFAMDHPSRSDLIGMFEVHARTYGGEVTSEDMRRSTFSSPQGIQALNYMRQMYVEDGSASLQHSMAAFGQGTVAMSITFPWRARVIRAASEDVFNDMRSALPPLGPTGRPESVYYGYVWAVSPYTNQEKEVYDFLQWLNTEVREDGTTRAGDVLTAMNSMQNQETDIRNQPFMDLPFNAGFIEALTVGAAKPQRGLPGQTEFTPEFLATVNAMVQGEISAEESAARLDQIIQIRLDQFFQ